jgi:5-(aminomethyl)-3-furanmethanol phosphate kinase
MAGEFNEPKIRVVKLGGSLLDWPPLQRRLAELIQQPVEPRVVNLIVVGGGAVVDAIRSYDTVHALDQVAVHWLCVELMNSTTKLAHMVFSAGQLLDSPESLEDWLAGLWSGGREHAELHGPPVAFVCPSAFYTKVLNADALPTSWDTSSDSISALLARLVSANELWLLKSTDAVSCTNGIVDPAFEKALPEGIAVRIINLRSQWE